MSGGVDAGGFRRAVKPLNQRRPNSAITAANDIWKDAPVNDSGAATSTMIADQATSRNESAVRSSNTARRAKAAMAQARWAGTGAPERAGTTGIPRGRGR